MDLRALGLTTLAVAVFAGAGVGVGYALSSNEDTSTVVIDAAPVPAQGPAYPRDKPLRIKPDPDYPTLATGLSTHREKVGTAPFEVSLPIPDGWVQGGDTTAGEYKWYPEPYDPATMANTYFVRLTEVGNRHTSPNAALLGRIRALSSATGVQDFQVDFDTPDSFVATYVAGGYRRVTMEQFFAPDGNTEAQVWLTVVGRVQDRDGLADLTERISSGLKFS